MHLTPEYIGYDTCTIAHIALMTVIYFMMCTQQVYQGRYILLYIG